MGWISSGVMARSRKVVLGQCFFGITGQDSQPMSEAKLWTRRSHKLVERVPASIIFNRRWARVSSRAGPG